MNISYHPSLKRVAEELREFLEEQKITLDINWIIGGDGSLFTYLDLEKPNFLISSSNSVGFYAGARVSDYKQKILDYVANPQQEEYNTIRIIINGRELPERALNDILITEGLHRLSKTELINKLSETIVYKTIEVNSGLLIYTPHGWNAFAKNIGAEQHEPLGVMGIAINKGTKKSRQASDLEIRISKRNRETEFKLFIDCKDIKPYDPSCTDRERVWHMPYKLKQGDVVKLSLGKPVKIIK